MGQSKLSPALACMETFWINESKPLELKSFSGICAPPCTCQWRWMFCEWNHVSLPSIMGSLHGVLSAIAFCMLLSAMLPHHGTLLSHSPALHCSWSSSMQPEIVHGEMMWKDHVPCGVKDCHQMPMDDLWTWTAKNHIIKEHAARQLRSGYLGEMHTAP